MKRPKTAAAIEVGKWLAGLKRSHAMVWRSGSRHWATEILARLRGWCATIDDPRDGCDLLLRFYVGDDALFSHCDDSNGDLGDLFRSEVKALFVGFARSCPDKEWIAAELFRLLGDDGYGVRDSLLAGARDYLPEPVLRSLVKRFQAASDFEPDEFQKRHWLMFVEMLAREIEDPVLFEQTRIRAWGKLNPAAHLEIAQIWFDCGDAGSARKWLESIPQGDNFKGDERDDLLVRVAAAQGDIEARDAAAWRRFRRFRNRKSLEELLAVIGPTDKVRLEEEEARRISSEDRLTESDALFLLETGLLDQAERYLLDRIAQVSGDRYGETLDLAEATAQAGKPLVSSLLYRALLHSILVHARRNAYRHGAKYLATLERLARSVGDWRGHPSHEAYLAELRTRHGLKKAFWALVD
ncbi:MAG TPA: hypothetical protein VN931_05605 [Fibrobacteria bacterium]|nr:hypothetical protein [Fibrobacteria bacterium]